MQNPNSVCYICKVLEIKPIEGADNIEQAILGGWSCVVRKDLYKVGDLVIIATTDAVIPENLANVLEIKNYLRKGNRVRTVKLKGVYSECLIIPTSYEVLGKIIPIQEGVDVMEYLGIHKYEPPIKTINLGGGRTIDYKENSNFHIYYKFPNIKNTPDMFAEDDQVEITRKLHGTNARYGIVKKSKISFWDRIKKLIGYKFCEYEFVVGSHHTEKGSDSQGYYNTNVWFTVNENYNIEKKLWSFVKDKYRNNLDNLGSGIILYGEIYGKGIQKNYDYGMQSIEFKAFDISINGIYLDVKNTRHIFKFELGLPLVEQLYTGRYSKEIQDSFVFNNYIKGSKIPHEGIVVKDLSGNRKKIAKVINPEYLIYGEKNNIGDSH